MGILMLNTSAKHRSKTAELPGQNLLFTKRRRNILSDRRGHRCGDRPTGSRRPTALFQTVRQSRVRPILTNQLTRLLVGKQLQKELLGELIDQRDLFLGNDGLSRRLLQEKQVQPLPQGIDSLGITAAYLGGKVILRLWDGGAKGGDATADRNGGHSGNVSVLGLQLAHFRGLLLVFFGLRVT